MCDVLPFVAHALPVGGSTEGLMNYENTIIGVANYSRSVGLPYKWILLDSWWYPKDLQGGGSRWLTLLRVRVCVTG